LDKNTEFYYKAAETFLLPVKKIENIGGFVLYLGRYNYYFWYRDTPFNNLCSSTIAQNKYYTNQLLKEGGIPVPKATVIHVSEHLKKGLLEQRIKALRFPLVIKPTNSGLGRDVLCNVGNLDQLHHYMDEHFPKYEFLSIEEFYAGLKSYRILVFNSRVIGILFREAASVISDGVHTIKQLIELENVRRENANTILRPIQMDKECLICLSEQKLSLNDIPEKNKKIALGYTSNTSRGGTFSAVDIKAICKENRLLMKKICRIMNLKLAGIDVECSDIGIPIEESGGVVIEVNHSPSIKIHEAPLHGSSTPVTKKIIRSLILRHPFAYFYTLYKNGKSQVYIKIVILLILLGILYILLP